MCFEIIELRKVRQSFYESSAALQGLFVMVLLVQIPRIALYWVKNAKRNPMCDEKKLLCALLALTLMLLPLPAARCFKMK